MAHTLGSGKALLSSPQVNNLLSHKLLGRRCAKTGNCSRPPKHEGKASAATSKKTLSWHQLLLVIRRKSSGSASIVRAKETWLFAWCGMSAWSLNWQEMPTKSSGKGREKLGQNYDPRSLNTAGRTSRNHCASGVVFHARATKSSCVGSSGKGGTVEYGHRAQPIATRQLPKRHNHLSFSLTVALAISLSNREGDKGWKTEAWCWPRPMADLSGGFARPRKGMTWALLSWKKALRRACRALGPDAGHEAWL